MTKRRVITWSVIGVLLLAGIVWLALPERVGYTTSSATLTVETGPDGSTPISLDTTYYRPKSADAIHQVPGILLAHGFGGTKDSVVDQAKDLVNHGYAVLTWTAEGFGRSGGQIHLDSPDWEIKDGSQLIDWLAKRPEIIKDTPDDPRVGVVGGSYGGAFSLLLAGYDKRVDAIVPMITWNDLASAFLPNAAGGSAFNGVFKKAWAGLFFGNSGGAAGPGIGGLTGTPGATAPSAAPTSPAVTPSATPSAATTPSATPSATPSGTATPSSGGTPTTGAITGTTPPASPVLTDNPGCGRFAPDICATYFNLASTGTPTPNDVALLDRSSPSRVLGQISAPTLLIQGEADSLFPLDQADANARGIAAAGTPVRVAWFTGGHDGGSGPQSDQDRLNFLTAQWFDYYLKRTGDAPSNSFTYSRVGGLDASNNGVVALGFQVPDYPGMRGSGTTSIQVDGPPQPAANPPGGNPAALSSLPGTGGAAASFVNGIVTDIPGQHADFYSEPLTHTVDVVGSPQVQIKVASPTGAATVFVKLYDVDPNSGLTLPDGLVAPVHLTGLPATIDAATPVTVTLPGIVHRFESGHRLRITVATSDQAYLTPATPTVYTISAADGSVTLPSVHSTPIPTSDTVWRWVLVGLLVALAVGIAAAILIARLRSRRQGSDVHPGHADTPLVVSGLRKEYADGFVAVSHLDLTVRRGQVLGLLGPNGAGKTTTLRVLMGLTQPTAGQIFVFGHRLVPGSPVLSRLGALVEGPGFLPHLSGRENLRLYWRSTGRPEADARMPEALDIAGLGDAIDRRVKTYSHGMKQRLAIAQAMLGLPELLVLDEPTDGLDPPQIAEMRRVLKQYATDGRAVLVSSHLLAEVEQVCTHVVVMHKGEKVADGPVDEVVGDSPAVQFEVSDADAAATLIGTIKGIRSVTPEGTGLVVDMNGVPRSAVVAQLVKAGIGVDRVAPRRRLEDAFLALVGGDTKASGER